MHVREHLNLSNASFKCIIKRMWLIHDIFVVLLKYKQEQYTVMHVIARSHTSMYQTHFIYDNPF